MTIIFLLLFFFILKYKLIESNKNKSGKCIE